MWRQLSQVVISPDIVSRLEALSSVGLEQAADLDKFRQGMAEIARELYQRAELPGSRKAWVAEE